MTREPTTQRPRQRRRWWKPVALGVTTVGAFIACWLAPVGSASGDVRQLVIRHGEVDLGTVPFEAPVSYAQAQDLEPAVQSPFRFDFEETANSYRGPAVEGYLYNSLPWTITNVRLRIESLDASGQVRGDALGWTFGHVPAHGRAYFFVSISVRGATYRATVVSFDKVLRHEPQSP